MADITAADVLQAGDGWLFLRRGSNDLEAQHTGRTLLNPHEQRVLRHVLTVRAERARLRQAGFLHVIVPNKETVYADVLAEAMPLARHRVVSQVREFGLPFVLSLEDALVAARATAGGLLYNLNNSYWNDHGAAIGYAAIMQALEAQSPRFAPRIDIATLQYREDNRTEGLEKYIGLAAEYREIRAVNLPNRAKLAYTNGIVNRGRIEVWTNEDGCGKATVFADSFTFNVLKRFLREQFAELHLVHSATADFSYVDETRPDLVMSVMIERFLPVIPTDWSAHTAHEIARSLGKAPT